MARYSHFQLMRPGLITAYARAYGVRPQEEQIAAGYEEICKPENQDMRVHNSDSPVLVAMREAGLH
jgi:hypothetical protein